MSNTSRFENGLLGWIAKWKAFVVLFGSISATIGGAAWGGMRHVNQVQVEIRSLVNDLAAHKIEVDRRVEDNRERILRIEQASQQSREAISGMKVDIAHMTKILERLETKIDNRHP